MYHLLLCIRHQEEGALGSLRTSPGQTVLVAEMDSNLVTGQPAPPRLQIGSHCMFHTGPRLGKLVIWETLGPGHLVQ